VKMCLTVEFHGWLKPFSPQRPRVATDRETGHGVWWLG